jgi:hypothetical protein
LLLFSELEQVGFGAFATGDEINLLIEIGLELFIAVEVKATSMPSAHQAAAFTKFTALHGEGSLRKNHLVSS